MSSELMLRALAYRMQERERGGLTPRLRARLLAVAGSARNAAVRSRTDRTVKAGTRFVREWNGRTYEVTATGDGRFAFGGATYRSLSAIARQITGTRWSGPMFFGLNEPYKKGPSR